MYAEFQSFRTLAKPGRTVKQEQEHISRNHVQAFYWSSVHIRVNILAAIKTKSENDLRSGFLIESGDLGVMQGSE